MRKAAQGRKIVLPEIAYPTSPITNGSEDKQAEFYRLAFEELSRNDGSFEAVNFMMLADLSDEDVRRLTQFYNLQTAKFGAVLQTLGVFDIHGRPKKAWEIFLKNVRR